MFANLMFWVSVFETTEIHFHRTMTMTKFIYLLRQLNIIIIYQSIYLSRSLDDRRGITDDLATSTLQLSWSSVFLTVLLAGKPVYSRMLSSHIFFCLPRFLSPCNVPCKIIQEAKKLKCSAKEQSYDNTCKDLHKTLKKIFKKLK